MDVLVSCRDGLRLETRYVILRRDTASHGGDVQHRLVGDAYVHGVMYGEGMTAFSEHVNREDSCAALKQYSLI